MEEQDWERVGKFWKKDIRNIEINREILTQLLHKKRLENGLGMQNNMTIY